MELKNFAGNKRALGMLSSLIEAGRLPHAILIEGESGLGKKTLARLLAQTLVCRSDDKPCGECAQCHKAQKGLHPDISEYIPSGAPNSFKIDMVRDNIRDAVMQPNEAEYKIYILAEAHCMNLNAQNALLKILEEPPEYAVFILTAQSKSAMLDTVLSRSYTVSLEGVPSDEGAAIVCDRLDGVDFATAKSVLETYNGNIGKTLDALKDSKTGELAAVCADICKALVDEREYSLLTACSKLSGDRQSALTVCTMLKNVFRDALVAGDGVEYTSGQEELAVLLRDKLGRQRLVSLVQTAEELKAYAEANANGSLLITKLCYSLRRASGK
jgi:DNA polymerase-3 subunit delta'